VPTIVASRPKHIGGSSPRDDAAAVRIAAGVRNGTAMITTNAERIAMFARDDLELMVGSPYQATRARR